MANDIAGNAVTLNAESIGMLNELSLAGLGGATGAFGSLLNQDVKISTPAVEVLAAPGEPFAGEKSVLLLIQQTQGLTSPVAYALKEQDAKFIAAMMMGGSAETVNAEPIDDLEQGAVIEAFSQVHAAVNSSLAGLLQVSVESDMPTCTPFSADKLAQGISSASIVSIGFVITLASGQTMPMVQYLPPDGAQAMVNILLGDESITQPLPPTSPSTEASMSTAGSSNQAASKAVDPVTVRPVEFSSFDQQHQVYGEENKNLELVMDVTLSLTVELGRTQLSIKDVLELTRGSVIELDRVAGEPVDLLANGKLIAKGEVVVIEDNFGLRITSIVSPADRLRGM